MKIQTLHVCLNTYLSEMKEIINRVPVWVARHPVEMPVKTLCFPLTLKQNAGRMFAEYWGKCSWGGPIKSVSNECVCVWTQPAVPVAALLLYLSMAFGFWVCAWMYLLCSLMECQDSHACSLCPGLFRPQPKSVCLFHQIGSNWSLCCFVLTMGKCLCLTRVPHQARASQFFLYCPSVTLTFFTFY